MIPVNLTRWILASVSKYMKDTCDDVDLPAIVEGLDDRDHTFNNATDRGEIRISGPFFKPFGATQHQCAVPVNVLVTSRYDGKKNAYLVEAAIGALVSAMDDNIPVFKLGNGNDDDPDEQLGCLRLNSDVRVFRLGQVNAVEKAKGIIVDASYIAEFDDE